MRIVHFSDLHIGVETYGRPLVETDLPGLPEWFAPDEARERYLGQSTRLVDFLSAFDELIDYAIGHAVDLVLFTGDAYKNRDPSQTHQREFAKRVRRLAEAGVPVFLLVGNHDLPHTTHRASAVEIFDVLGVPNVTTAERLGVYRVETPSGPLQVLALPWIRRSALLAREDVRSLPYEQFKKLLEDRLTEMVIDAGETLDPAVPSVLAAHVSVSSAKPGTECTMMIGQDHVLLQSDLAGRPVDYIALGHIHRGRSCPHRGRRWCTRGACNGSTSGEEDHEAKGFYVLDLDPAAELGQRMTGPELRPVQARSFVTIDQTVGEDDLDPTATVLRAIERHHIRGAIVRVRVKMPASAAAVLRERDIRRALEEAGAHTVASFSREIEREKRTRLGAVSLEGRTPTQVLELYLHDPRDAERPGGQADGLRPPPHGGVRGGARLVPTRGVSP